MKIIILIPFFVFVQVHSDYKEDVASKISAGLNKLYLSGQAPKQLTNAISELRGIKNKTLQDEQMCTVCRNIVDNVISYRRSGQGKLAVLNFVKMLCRHFSNMGDLGCNGMANIEIDAILYIIDNRKNLTSERVCAIYLQERQCEDATSENWNINIPPKPITNVKEAECDGNIDKVLHLTDIHYDPMYLPGSNAKCNEMLCCQSGVPKEPSDAAGYWGDYNVCDMPWHSVLDLMGQIKKQHEKIDYIYYTGDIVDHKSFATSIQENSNTLRKVFRLFAKMFGNVPVYPVLGNHEAHPTDLYAPNYVNSSAVSTLWLFELATQEWSRWLPKDTESTILKGGYYTSMIRPKLRLIALNSNVCYTANIWLIYDDQDPFNQLQWLVDTLLLAENNRESVHIISHFPPGDTQCWKMWTREYNKIVNRFSKTIVAQFNGHTHMDEIKLFFDTDKQNVINVAYNGASFTTFVGFNPNYRIYDIDSNTYVVSNYDQWIYNISEANENKNKSPRWYKLYSFKDAYGVNSMDYEAFHNITENMKNDKTNRTLLKQYYRFLVRESLPYMSSGCDDNCLTSLYCRITNVDFEDAIKCGNIL